MGAIALPGRGSLGYRVVSALVVLALVMPLTGPIVPAAAQGVGETDPARGFSKWPDDELLVVQPTDPASGQQHLRVFEPGSDLKTETEVASAGLTTTHGAVAVATGRFLTPAHDSALFGYRYMTSMLGLSFVSPALSEPISKLSSMAPRVAGGTDFFDMASGDLDLFLAPDGDYRDEAVVVWAQPDAFDKTTDGKLAVSVAVLSFEAAGAGSPVPTATTRLTLLSRPRLDTASLTDGTVKTLDNSLGVTLGDFDGDGAREIAVAYFTGPRTLTIEFLKYSLDKPEYALVRSLVLVGSATVTLDSASVWNQNLSLAAGDFDGDASTGRDELALATSERKYVTTDTNGTKYYGERLNLRLFRTACTDGANCATSPALTVTAGANVTDIGIGQVAVTDADAPRKVQIVSGLFNLDPANLNRRQIAAAYSDPPSMGRLERCGRVRILSVDPTLTVALGNPVTVANSLYQNLFWITAGGFKGSRTASDPVWSLAFAYWTPTDYMHAYVHPQAFPNPPTVPDQWGSIGPATPPAGARAPVAALDWDGDSVYLGAPTHMTLYDVVNLDFILQEPPKHAYWDPAAAMVQNVSRVEGFNITLRSAEGTTFTSKSTDTADWSIGGSVAVSAKETVAGSASCIIASASASASLALDGKVGYDYAQHESSFGVSDQTRTVTFTGVTNTDDYLVGRLQVIHVWRYRLYGVTLDNGQNAYYEIVIPGGATGLQGEVGVLQTDANGLNFDWYQPVHENGNILSYPAFSSATTFNPPDLGSYTIPCTPGSPDCVNGQRTVTELMLEPRLQYCDGGSGDRSLTFTDVSGGGSERSSSHKLAENLSVTASVSASAEAGLEGNKTSLAAEMSVTAELHNSNSWGRADTSSYQTSASTGITLNRMGCSSDTAYAYYPVLYQATDGTIKATFAVDPLASNTGKGFWIDEYGQLPDPALNLPSRFYLSPSGDWVPTVRSTRQQMRGFFVKHSTASPITGLYDLYPGAVADGDVVRLEARVYNYGTTQAVRDQSGARVAFYAAPYDASTNRETGPRVPIGATDLPAMNPLQMVTVAIEWDTGDMSLGTKQDYRIYVVLDPDNALAEKQEIESKATQFYYDAAKQDWLPCRDLSETDYAAKQCIDPGQNNEGFGYVTVARPALSAGPGQPLDADISMDDWGLATLDASGTVVNGPLEAQYGQPIPVRITIHSDTRSQEHRQVLVFDGDPAAGGVAIAGKMVFAGSTAPEGSSVWFDWMPPTVGPHILYAVVTEMSGDAVPDNNTDTMEITVRYPPTTNYLPSISH